MIIPRQQGLHDAYYGFFKIKPKSAPDPGLLEEKGVKPSSFLDGGGALIPCETDTLVEGALTH
jgi:hypothetical protein